MTQKESSNTMKDEGFKAFKLLHAKNIPQCNMFMS